MHEENGVKFYLSAGVKEIVGDEGKVTGVTLPSGETLEAEMVVAGVGKCRLNVLHIKELLMSVGVVPATDFLKGSDLPLTGRGELKVDEVCRNLFCV